MAAGPATGSLGAPAVFVYHGRTASHLPAAFSRLGVVAQPGDRPTAIVAEELDRKAASGTCLRPVVGGVLSGAVGLGGDAEETASTSAASHQGERRGRLLLDEAEAFRSEGRPGPASEEALERRAFEAHRRVRDMRGMPSSTGSSGPSGSVLAGGSQRSSRSDGSSSGHTVLQLLPSLESRTSRSSRAPRGEGTSRRSGACSVRINVLPTPRTPVAALASARRSGADLGEDQAGAASGVALFPARRPSRRFSPSDLRRPAGVGKKWLAGAGMTREEEAGAVNPDLVSKPRASTAVGTLRQLLGLRVGAPLAVRRPLEEMGGAPVQQDSGSSTSVTLSAGSGHTDSTSSPHRFAALEPSLSSPSRRLPCIQSTDARRGFGSHGLRRKAPGKPAAAKLLGSVQAPGAPADGGHTPAQADTCAARSSGGTQLSAAAGAHAIPKTPRGGAKLPAGIVYSQRGGQLGRALPIQLRLRAGLPTSPSRRLPGGMTLTLQPVVSPRRGPDTPPPASPRLRHVEAEGARPASKYDSSRSEAVREASAVGAQSAEPPLLPLRRGAKVMRFAADDSPSLLYAGNGLRVGGPPRGSGVSTASSAGGTTRRFSLLTSLGHLLHLPASATPASAVAARLARSTRDLQADYRLAAFAPTRVRVLLAVPAGEGGSPSDSEGEGEGAASDVASEAKQRCSRAAEKSGIASRGDGDCGAEVAVQDLTAGMGSSAGAAPAVRAAGSEGPISHRSGGSVSRPVVPPLAALARRGGSFASREGADGASSGGPIHGAGSARSAVVVVLKGWTPRDFSRSPRHGHASCASAAVRHTIVTTVAGSEGVSKPASEGFLRSALRAIGRWLPGNDAPVQEPGASAQLARAQTPAAAARGVPVPAPAEHSLPRRTPALSSETAELPQPGEQGRHTRASHAYPLLANPLHSRIAVAHRAARGGAAGARPRLRASGDRVAMGAAAATVSNAAWKSTLDVPWHLAPRTAAVPGSPARLSGTRQRLEGSAAVSAAAAAALRPGRLSEVRHGGGRARGLVPPARSGSPDDLGGSGGDRPSLNAMLRSGQRLDAWVGGTTPRSPAMTPRPSATTSRLAAASPTLQRPSHVQAHGVRGFVAAGAGAAAARFPALAAVPAVPAAPAVEVLPRAQLSARAAAAALRLHQWHGRGELRAGEEFAGVNPMQARALRLQQPEAAADGGAGVGVVSTSPRRASVAHWLLGPGAAPQQGNAVRAPERRLSLTGTHERSWSGPMHAPGAADATPRAGPGSGASSAASGRVRVVLSGTIPRLRERERGTLEGGDRQSPGQASPSTGQRQLGWRGEPSTRAASSPQPGLAGRRRNVGSESTTDAFTAAPAARRVSLPSPPAPHRSRSGGARSATRPLLSADRRREAPAATPPAFAAQPPTLSYLPASSAAALRDGTLSLGASSCRLQAAAAAAAPAGELDVNRASKHAEAAAAGEPAGATRERWDAFGSEAAGKKLQLFGAPAAHGSAGSQNTAGPSGSSDRGGMPVLDFARRIRDVADIAMSGSPKAEGRPPS
jgi:hypothetical protein